MRLAFRFNSRMRWRLGGAWGAGKGRLRSVEGGRYHFCGCGVVPALRRGLVKKEAAGLSAAGVTREQQEGRVNSGGEQGKNQEACMRWNPVVKRAALGAASGLAGTMALQAVRAADQKLMPEAQGQMKMDPGEYMVTRAKQVLPARVRVWMPEALETGAAMALAVGYGVAFGALYAAARPRTQAILRDGAAMGLTTWAAGYLGWLPRTGLTPPVWKQRPKQVVLPMLEHVAYGVATVAAYEWLRKRM